MNPFRLPLGSFLVVSLIIGSTCTLAQTPSTAPATQPAAGAGAAAGIDHLRDAIKSAYNDGDVDGILQYIHPDAVIIFPDGRILKGREELRDYYAEMLTGPSPVVKSYTADPQVASRTVHDDVGLSYGMMNDHYVLTDGTEFGLNSRFSVTVFKSPQGPADTGGWMIRSFHSSTDAFDNPILKIAAKRTMWAAGGVSLAVGVIAGLVIGALLRKRATTAAATPGS